MNGGEEKKNGGAAVRYVIPLWATPIMLGLLGYLGNDKLHTVEESGRVVSSSVKELTAVVARVSESQVAITTKMATLEKSADKLEETVDELSATTAKLGVLISPLAKPRAPDGPER